MYFFLTGTRVYTVKLILLFQLRDSLVLLTHLKLENNSIFKRVTSCINLVLEEVISYSKA